MARPKTKIELGRWGEQQAEHYLTARGLTCVERNARTPYGELDLVMQDVHGLVFVEVKTRTSREYGLPEEAVTARKADHIRQAAEAYLQAHADLPTDWRVDVIAVSVKRGEEVVEIEWFENVLS